MQDIALFPPEARCVFYLTGNAGRAVDLTRYEHLHPAERDVVVNARRRWPAVQFEIREVAVQGTKAVREVSAALKELDAREDVDVIIISRGGGSLEDLLPFSDEQLTRLAGNYPCDIFVGQSDQRIPPEYIKGTATAPQERGPIPRPTLDEVNDGIIDGEWDAFHGEEKPLFHFGAQRFDIACARIEHYTGIEVDTVQKYILFTNYAMHTTEFVKFGLRELTKEDSRYTALVLPNGETIHPNDAVDLDVDGLTLTSRYQMPRFDLITAGGDGITMINIGVGPSNAKTITDCLAVLRPEAWIMIGHCAGMDGRMRIGDLILGNAYQRNDHILDQKVAATSPIPAIPEVQRMLESAVKAVYGDDNSLMRTGTVLSTDDRNWEWRTNRDLWEWLRTSTAVAVDMESCTLAANGYRYRVPYGTLLSVSDLPLHAVPKLPAQAQAFYSNSKEAHVMCAVRAMEHLAENPERLRTRKLRRTLGEVPFR